MRIPALSVITLRRSAVGSLLMLLALGVTASLPVLALESDTDVEGSADFPLLKRYPHSHIVRYDSSSKVEPYTLVLGTLKEVQGFVSPEDSRQIDGLVTRITYRIPDGNRSDEVFDYFRKQLVEQRADMLFVCRGLDCGGSNNWANRIFHIAMLYGPEQFQNYLAARVEVDGREQFVALYTLQRGNRRLYAHMEVIASVVEENALTEREEIVETLQSSGRYPLVGVDFDAGGKLTKAAQEVLNDVARALRGQTNLRLYVVGHLEEGGSLDESVNESTRRAEQVVTYLVGHGLDAKRLTAAGVGPLAPTVGVSRNHIELVRIE